MTSVNVKYLVGLFMTLGLGITVAAIIWLGASRSFEKGQVYVCFFDESVQGLNIDSPVKYRGVPVGRVRAIRVAEDAELIEVHVKLQPEYTPDKVAKLVAFLQVTGLTGAVYIEMNLQTPEESGQYRRPTIKGELPVLLTRSSRMKHILSGIDILVDKLSVLEPQKFMANAQNSLNSLTLALKKVNRILDDPRLDSTLSAVEHSSQKLEKVMDLAAVNLRKTGGVIEQAELLVQEGRQGIQAGREKMETLLTTGTSFVSQTDENLQELHRQLLLSSRNLVRVTKRMEELLEQLQERPSELLFDSRPPELHGK